ncbi:MAG: GNAT family N-acetyltransferase [Deltaproteobacteria bacterium]|nr:GNAT family N-acetyltransferase [Deltaproteobacteria bacterium]
MDDEATPALDRDAVVEDLAHLLARVASLRCAVAWDAGAFELPDLHEVAAVVLAHEPADPSPPVTQDALDALVAWATAGGARLAPGLQVCVGPRGARVSATAPIAAGAPLVEVPVALMMRTRDVFARYPAIAAWLGEPLFGPGTLMLWLLCARYGAAGDPWAPYVDALPPEVPGTALSWPRSPGAHLVAASLGRSFLAGVLQLYCLVYRRLRDTAPAQRPLPLEAFTLRRWLWAGAILSSRQTGVGDELVLVPLWDLLDHDEAIGAETTALVDDTLRCTAGAAYAAGDAVAMFSGRRTPSERWVFGGFVPPGPPDGARAALAFSLPLAAPLREDKLVWLSSDRDRAVEVTIGRGDLEAARARARWYALDDAELRRLELASVADAWDRPLTLSPAGEARAEVLLRDWLVDRAGPATPTAPFSAEHARVLAAAHARYAGLITDGALLLDDSDAARVDAFLAAHAATSTILRHNLHAAGLTFTGMGNSGTWAASTAGDAICGVVSHARNGHLFLQAPIDPGALARHAVARSGREIAGLAGPRSQVEVARAALGLADRPVAVLRHELAYALELAALRQPATSRAQVRRAGPDDHETLVSWRGESARASVELQLAQGRTFVAEVEGALVATVAIAWVIDDTALVADVFTPIASRGRGHAGVVIAGALAAARSWGATRAVLLVDADNAAARALYARLGFALVGDHGIVIFADGTT